MVSLNIDKTFGFISKASVEAYEGVAMAARKTLEDGTGKGNDFLGWLHLPSSITKADLDDIYDKKKDWVITADEALKLKLISKVI